MKNTKNLFAVAALVSVLTVSNAFGVGMIHNAKPPQLQSSDAVLFVDTVTRIVLEEIAMKNLTNLFAIVVLVSVLTVGKAFGPGMIHSSKPLQVQGPVPVSLVTSITLLVLAAIRLPNHNETLVLDLD